ncbi:hypothetical protein FE257_006290 [Aspergillus nanangensis]|uniref:NAD-dependent epimerase/dehydratase domain-containing protein n=1 Tax=Aspergillus nanangensis TaxID=2582783 RepID=A0AAD4GU04_ASPNN|nr:hypothetical protein FE257_006290 [Aspergillus nanangensis]
MPAETVLITGASGFIATHIVDAFLQAGHTVRGTVRSQSTADRVKQTFLEYVSKDKLTFAIVPDIGVPHAFDEAVKGVTGVIHTASPFEFKVDDNEQDILLPAINGTKHILDPIKKNGSQVRRLVILSSFAAIVDVSKGTRPGYVYTEKDWNPLTYDEAAKKGSSTVVAYLVSKKLAERAAWDFVERERPGFDVVTICPPMVYGPNMNATASIAHLNESSAEIYRLMTAKPTDPVPPTSFWGSVDARDVAQAHLKAYETPEAGGQRFLVCQDNYSYQQMVDVLREKVPEVKDRVPVGKPHTGLGEEVYGIDNSKSRKVLGLHYRSFEETVVDAARSLLELAKKG